MKSFSKYLAESERTYNYRIKFCGDVPTEVLNKIKSHLVQFDVVKMGDMRSSLAQEVPTDFPNARNQQVHMLDISVRYPAVEPQIKQLAQLSGFDPNLVCMQEQQYADSIADEYNNIKTQSKDLLKNTDFPANNAKQKALSKDHAAAAEEHAVLQNSYRSDFTIAGGKTPAAKTSNDAPVGTKSPMSTTKRPPKPKTGAHS